MNKIDEVLARAIEIVTDHATSDSDPISKDDRDDILALALMSLTICSMEAIVASVLTAYKMGQKSIFEEYLNGSKN